MQMEYKDYHREVLWDSGPGGDGPDGGDPDAARTGDRREVDFFMRQAHPVIALEDPREWRTSRICR